ncbi:MAG: hypothetical protein AB2784_19915 [Candidatus Thiodiazotropha endolucinida]
MEVSEDDLRENIANMSDEELLVRWRSNAFSETAHKIAVYEIKNRKLDTSDAAVDDILKDEQRASEATKMRAKKSISKMLIILFAFIVSTIGAVIAGLLLGK